MARSSLTALRDVIGTTAAFAVVLALILGGFNKPSASRHGPGWAAPTPVAEAGAGERPPAAFRPAPVVLHAAK